MSTDTTEREIAFADGLEGVLLGECKRGAVLISHGAGGNMRTPLLVKTAERLAAVGFMTLRWNFGYTTRGGAPSAAGKRERPEMIAAISHLEQLAPGKPIVLLGKSFGGRVSTFIVQDVKAVAGFVFYGLPIQSMSAKGKPRDWSHLSQLMGRVLFITGDKDKLCPLADLETVQKNIVVPFESIVVPGDHSFKPKGETQALEACIKWFEANF